MCPGQESNLQLFGVRDNAPVDRAPWPGPHLIYRTDLHLARNPSVCVVCPPRCQLSGWALVCLLFFTQCFEQRPAHFWFSGNRTVAPRESALMARSVRPQALAATLPKLPSTHRGQSSVSLGQLLALGPVHRPSPHLPHPHSLQHPLASSSVPSSGKPASWCQVTAERAPCSPTCWGSRLSGPRRREREGRLGDRR